LKEPGITDADLRVVVIGAGPAGLTAAYELMRNRVSSLILEKDPVVGGLARTVRHQDYLFDIGGHRFYTKVSLVQKIWEEVLGGDFITRPRLSRIFYNGAFFQYPLSAIEALKKLGVVESMRCMTSYLRARLRPVRPEDDLESWLRNRFGQRLFEIFFKTYTEKVWGLSCREIRADWAAQRIRGLSLSSLIRNTIAPARGRAKEIKTLIQEFQYPRKGPGMMWERMRDMLKNEGTQVVLNAPVHRICWRPGAVVSVETPEGSFACSHLISSMPIRELIQALDPAPPQEVRDAAHDFRYRDFVTVALIVRSSDLFADNWIYIHDPGVKVGRIQNFGNWSPEMIPDPSTSCLGFEYFCQEGDELWNSTDSDLVALATRELAKLGLASPDRVAGGAVVRMPKAYPVYDAYYRRGLDVVKRFLSDVPNLQLIGRNGMHRYNNQDHSMLTGVFAARNILGAHYDLWEASVDEEYFEEGRNVSEEELRDLDHAQPKVPQIVKTES